MSKFSDLPRIRQNLLVFPQRVSAISFINVSTTIEFFAFNTKLPDMAILASNDFSAAKKVYSSEA